jgi:two-component system sensor histidine kinase AlgZ
LHARIRPHFLFNTLNSIASLIPIRPVEAEAMVVDFAQLLRAALAEAGLVRLADELAVVRGYLAIEAVRLEGRLRVVWSGDVLDDAVALQRVRVPSLSIQPLVENAVRYGVEPLSGGGEVWIDISRAGDEVVVTVRNALVALGERREGAGMALANVRARVFAQDGRLEVVRGEGVFEARLVVLGAGGAQPSV